MEMQLDSDLLDLDPISFTTCDTLAERYCNYVQSVLAPSEPLSTEYLEQILQSPSRQ